MVGRTPLVALLMLMLSLLLGLAAEAAAHSLSVKRKTTPSDIQARLAKRSFNQHTSNPTALAPQLFSQVRGEDDVLVARRRRPRRRSKRKRRSPARPPQAAPAPAPAPAPEPSPGGAPLGSVGGTTRVEFEGQLIKGQTTKAGEVQVLERRDTELKSMVKRRTSFREEIIRTVFPDFGKKG